MPEVTLHLGDCLDVLRTLPDGSVDCVVTDPPYPHIKRSYGVWTEAEWFALMDRVVPECRRVLKPIGSAIFVLQPNSERVGRMRTWLWKFLAKWGEEWGIVQDAWWWNTAALPTGGATSAGLLRGSLKACVWLGLSDCYRDQDACLWAESLRNAERRASDRFVGRVKRPSGQSMSVAIFDAAEKRGGVTPFNVLPIPNTASNNSAGGFGHSAGTPFALADWWLRYVCPRGGVVLDPFNGSGTVALASIKQGKSAIGIEIDPAYHAIAQQRIKAEQEKTALIGGVTTNA